ncbi:P-loop containing nucleoside triphosphate hydrolase protein [Xylaria digitata]|nr:P-loop containing nucleoside triphosphate hydrolase protein [Xylaria digitata]
MSVAEYENAVPKAFTKVEVEQNANQPAVPRVWKGFAHIVEYHPETLAGRKKEIIPIHRLIPKQRNDIRKAPKYDYYAIVLRRTWVPRRRISALARIELEIQLEELCQALWKIVTNTYEGTDLNSFPIKINCPFSELFFYRDEIKALADDKEGDGIVCHQAQVLYEFVTINSLISSILFDYEKYYDQGQVVSDILWTIYPPNSILVVKVGMIQECWVCRNVSIKNTGFSLYWIIDGFRVGYNGSSLGTVRQTFYIPMTTVGVCKISDLPIVPLEKYTGRDALKEKLLRRATKMQQMIGDDFSSFSSQHYTGIAWRREFSEYYAEFNPLPDAKRAQGQARGQVENIDIEPMGMQSSGSDDEPAKKEIFFDPELEDPLASRPFSGSVAIEESSESELYCISNLLRVVTEVFHVSEESFKLPFPALVPAFSLRNKEWWWLITDNLRDVNWNAAAFGSLQLEPNKKDLVQSLVRGHKHKSIMFDDVMSGKGQGLIFLFHGKPGLGKTFTAESVAEDLNRPLYSISGRELSTDVAALEEKLNEIFDLAKRWDAVSLLDEADVLLCKRNSQEMDRNAIVAGVLILTTNRKQDFDDASKSRIHTDESWADEAFTRLGAYDINGRTIKDILRTAVAYANAKNEPLGIGHVDVIAQAELEG